MLTKGDRGGRATPCGGRRTTIRELTRAASAAGVQEHQEQFVAQYHYWQRSVGFYGPHPSIPLFTGQGMGEHVATRVTGDTLIRTIADINVTVDCQSANLPPEYWWFTNSFLFVVHHDPNGLAPVPDPESGDSGIVIASTLQPTLVHKPSDPTGYTVRFAASETLQSFGQRKGIVGAPRYPTLSAWLYSYDLANALTGAPAHALRINATCYLRSLWGSQQPF